MNKQKIALITGGNRGLGRNMALQMAGRGHDVIITYNSNKQEAEAVVKDIEQQGRRAAALQLDTGNTGALPDFFAALEQVLQQTFGTGRIDYLVNNAGFGVHLPSFAETPEQVLDALLNVHFKGVFLLTQRALPYLNDGGGIVNVSTGLTRFTYPGSGAYASVKAAVETLTRYLARELGPRGIRVNVVAPGAIATDFNGGLLKNTPKVQEYVRAITALPRIGQADDIGGIVAFLCSDDAKWITGQRIEASGGMNL